jgi:aldose sugar dehydrogenase
VPGVTAGAPIRDRTDAWASPGWATIDGMSAMSARSAAAVVAVAAVIALAGCDASSGPSSATPPATLPTSSPTPSATDGSPVPSPPATGSVRVLGTVATGLTTPWGIAFLPDGRALVGERDTGRIRLVGTGTNVVVGTVPGAVHDGEGGLLGLALSPRYASDHLLYAYTTTATDNRIVRMTYAGAGLGAPAVVLSGIPHGNHHNGGRLAFGPDGMLYATTGETGDAGLAQDRSSLGGKILRMTPDGRPAPGNPFPKSVVWTYGHRNVEGLAFDASGQLWATEFGASYRDELNHIVRGGNYGWPMTEGFTDAAGVTGPVVEWPTDDAGPSGIAIVDQVAWIGGLTGHRLWRVPLYGTTVGRPQAFEVDAYGRLRTVALAPDGSLWVTTSNTDGRGDVRPGDDRILRLSVR